MSTILCFIVCSIAIVVIDYHLEQSMTQQLLVLSTTTSGGGISNKRTTVTTTIKSPLNDPTLQWDNEQYPHVWLAYEQQQAEILASTSSTTTTTTTTTPTNVIPKPPYMILWTEYGWNHRQVSIGLSYARCYRATEYIQSIIHHPYFHPTAYHEMMVLQNRTVDPNMTYYLFLDIETCYESNYPNYGKSYYGNCDDATMTTSTLSSSSSSPRRRLQKRTKYSTFYIKYMHPKSSQCYDFQNCHYIQQELQTNPIFSHHPSNHPNNNNNNHYKNKLILLDCRGNGQRPQFRYPPVPDNDDTERGTSPHVVLVSLSSTLSQLNLAYGDHGLPPPAIQHIPYRTRTSSSSTSTTLDGQYQQEMIVETCSATSSSLSPSTTYRKYLLSFSGNYKRHTVRQELAKLDNVRTNRMTSVNSNTVETSQSSSLVLITDTKELYENTNGMTYSELLMSSQYFAVPRGDNLYSYRFSEVLSSGAIPVLIHNEEWVLPFRSEIVDWDQCVIRISTEQIHNTVSILQNISLQEQCQRRQYCYSIYERYMINSSATIQGILDGLQAMQHQ
jgi:hypothetical protein